MDGFKTIRLVAAKVLRWTFADIESLIQRTPDMYIVHFIRDPRAIATSRRYSQDMHYMYPWDNRTSTEARLLCIRMRQDLAERKAYEAKYPGLFLTLRYEDYLLHPHEMISKIFKFLGVEEPKGIHEWIMSVLYGDRETGPFETVRINGTASIDKWKKKVDYAEGLLMNSYCAEALNELGYKI